MDLIAKLLLRARNALLAICCAVVAGVFSASAAADIFLTSLPQRGFRIDGTGSRYVLGIRVSGAGDVNGDGLADMVVSAVPPPESPWDFATGEVYVVFGKRGYSTVDLSGSFDGLLIKAVEPESGMVKVSGAGDFNGDGLADIVIGAPNARVNDQIQAGRAYIVFGRRQPGAVDLNNLGSGGEIISGAQAYSLLGLSVSGAGDVNGDGLSDVLIGAPGAGVDDEGRAYIVLGRRTVGTTGPSVSVISGNSYFDRVGRYVSGAGDVNGDGLSDVIIRGSDIHVIFGTPQPQYVNTAYLSAERGVTIEEGGGFRSFFFSSVSGLGDINGDGYSDFAVTSPLWNGELGDEVGTCFIFWGGDLPPVLDSTAFPDHGFRLEGTVPNGRACTEIAGAGDFNGDGLAEFIIGTESYYYPEEEANAFLVNGTTSAITRPLSWIRTYGTLVRGEAQGGDGAGRRVSAAGDVNGDGLSDFLVSASATDTSNGENSGRVYVVFSDATPPAVSTYRSFALPGNFPVTPVGVPGDGSGFSTPDSRAWIGFADGQTANGGASQQTVTITRMQDPLAGTVATVNWNIVTDRIGFTEARVKFRYLDEEIRIDNEAHLSLAIRDGSIYRFVRTGLDTATNTIEASVTELGAFVLVDGLLFGDGFE